MSNKSIEQIRIEELHTINEMINVITIQSVEESQRIRNILQELFLLQAKIETELALKTDYAKAD